MKRCPSCSRVYSDMVSVCPICHINLTANDEPARNPVPSPKNSASATRQPVSYQPQPVQTNAGTSTQQSKPDKGNWFWLVPGLLIPLAGVIAWLCLKKNHPASAKIAIYGALAGFLLNMALRFL